MDTIDFSVQGSAQESYKVTFQKVDQHLAAFCTCQAGQNGQYCKHRFNILSGSTEGISSNNPELVAMVVSWLPGTDLEAALNSLGLAEAEFERAKKALVSAKKNVAAVMRR